MRAIEAKTGSSFVIESSFENAALFASFSFLGASVRRIGNRVNTFLIVFEAKNFNFGLMRQKAVNAMRKIWSVNQNDLSNSYGLSFVSSGDPSDREQALSFGFDAWGEGKSMPDFVRSYDGQSGTRYQLWANPNLMVAGINVFDFGNGLRGIASVAVKQSERKQGWLNVLMPAIHQILIAEGAQRFALFSEVPQSIYEKYGYVRCPNLAQQFLPSVAMIMGGWRDEDVWWKSYF
jgi:hypothetical protein